jgi:hypothetical protein
VDIEVPKDDPRYEDAPIEEIWLNFPNDYDETTAFQVTTPKRSD